MKIKVDIFMGIIGSGKTNFIKSLLESGQLNDECVVVMQNEIGKVNIKKVGTENNIFLVQKEIDVLMDEEYIKNIIKRYCPDRIIIECNGMEDINKVISVFEHRCIRKLCEINTTTNIIDGKKLNMFLINLGSIVREHIINSKIIILNNTEDMSKKELQSLKKSIKSINEVAKIIIKDELSKDDYSYNSDLCITNEVDKANRSKFILIIALLILILSWLIASVFNKINIQGIELTFIRSFNTRFLGILLETIPFILLGAFVSAIIQFFIPSEALMKIFPKNKFLASVIASFVGIFFPVCDCGTIPVARGFLKKGVPISAVITFILAAPIVNPIAIMSTIYAFPNNKEVVLYRLLLGIIIAVIVGLIMGRKQRKEIFTDNLISCDCQLCNGDYYNNIFAKVKGVFIHAGDEFFNIGKFMIIGAFLCSVMQTFLSQEYFNFIPTNMVGSLVIMIIFSLFFSVCSTSDAFVAKGFLGQFSMNNIIAFLILGPMIAIKNIMILLGSFKKAFVFKLLFVIISVSFTLLISLGLFI